MLRSLLIFDIHGVLPSSSFPPLPSGGRRVRAISKAFPFVTVVQGTLTILVTGTSWFALLITSKLKLILVLHLALNHTIPLFLSWPLLILLQQRERRFALVSVG